MEQCRQEARKTTELLSKEREKPLDLLKHVASILKTKRDIHNIPLQENTQGNKKIFLVETLKLVYLIKF